MLPNKMFTARPLNRVDDEGISLNAHDAGIIFERYGRGDAAVRQGISGHGLGLFIWHQIVESHGGTIYARALGSGGSSFTFTIPRRARH
ncbi:MAG TPA: ATP-binding protein [Chloroflexota bacterium]